MLALVRKYVSTSGKNSFYLQNLVFLQVERLFSTTDNQSLIVINNLSTSGHITLFFNEDIIVSTSERLLPLLGKVVSTTKGICFRM